MARYAVCKCFLKRNIYVKEWQVHVTFVDREHFKVDYAHRCPSEQILSAIETEVKRRKGLQDERGRNRRLLENAYAPADDEVYHFSLNFLDPNFGNTKPLGRQVFTMPVFTKEFCEKLLREIKSVKGSGLPLTRPNSMNKSGLLLDDVGFTKFFDEFRTKYLQPICDSTFPDLGFTDLDTHRAFIVHYKADDNEEFDRGLDNHYDNAELTLNVSLSATHEGGELVFDGFKREPPGSSGALLACEHRSGHGILHRGDHIHRALPIESGERWNLILWLRSSEHRNRDCPMCGEIPDLSEVASGSYGDGFTI